MKCTVQGKMVFMIRRYYAVLLNKFAMNNYISRREKERNAIVDKKLYECLKKKMLGKPMNKLQQKYLNEKKRDFAPLFLNQLKPQMILYKKAIQANELPLPKYPELAFIGRSNCGKSTLINELSGRTNKAKVSKVPGCTQVLHFYKIGKPCVLCLVDLPGYGFSYCKEELRLQWNEFTLFYLKNRTNLRKVFVLIDCRVGLKNSDKELFFFFDKYNVPYQIILSKCDLVNTKDLAIKIQILKEELQIFKNIKGPVIPVSSLKKQNLDELRNEIAKYQLNRQTVNQNILMRVNDLIEQKRLKNLKLSKGETKISKESVSIQKKEEGTNNSNKIVKEILLKEETIETALNRWKVNKTISASNSNFNMYMNHHVKRLIEKMKLNFIENCIKEYNSVDLKVIDTIIEQQEQEQEQEKEQAKQEKHNPSNWKKDMHITSVKHSSNHEVDNQQNKNPGVSGRKNRKTISKTTITETNERCETYDELLHSCYFYENHTNNENNECIQGIRSVTEDEQKINTSIKHEEDVKDNEGSFQVNENTVENELIQKSIKYFKGKVENNQHLFYSENVEMEKLFHTKNEKAKELYSHDTNLNNTKKKDYLKTKEKVILLDEEDTYTEEDYLKGLKKPLSKMHNNSLYNFEFNLIDKKTHTIYEKSKADAYKAFQKNQLEKLYEKDVLKTSEKEKNEDISKKTIFEKQKEKTEITPKDSLNYKYIGLKSRKYRVKGTKKLKLFGKKKNKEIINVPKDLASDYFKLPESNYIEKKKTTWNYINNKYNKWLKKMKKKKLSEEINTPVKKKDVMIRYVEKEKHKHIKEQNKLLRKKEKLGMLTKPPKNKNIRKRVSRNYTISNDQKIFDRDAFFKYRDVQK